MNKDNGFEMNYQLQTSRVRIDFMGVPKVPEPRVGDIRRRRTSLVYLSAERSDPTIRFSKIKSPRTKAYPHFSGESLLSRKTRPNDETKILRLCKILERLAVLGTSQSERKAGQ